jgi:PAS domain S-box-containing protein
LRTRSTRREIGVRTPRTPRSDSRRHGARKNETRARGEDLLRRVAALPQLATSVRLQPLLAACREDEPQAPIVLADLLVGHCEDLGRRLVEVQTQLVAVREIAASLTASRDIDAALRTLARYLRGALEVHQLVLAQADWEHGVLRILPAEAGEAEVVDLPLRSDSGLLAVSVLTNAPCVSKQPAAEPLLGSVNVCPASSLASFAVVPLPAASTVDGCGSRTDCAIRANREAWSLSSHATSTQLSVRCAACHAPPVTGALALLCAEEEMPLAERHLALAESLAGAVGTALENARLRLDLERERSFLAQLVHGLPLGVIATDSWDRVLSMNGEAERLAGLSASACHGRPLSAVLGWVEGEAHATVPGSVCEAVLRQPDGRDVPVAVATAVLRDAQGLACGRIVSFADLTERKRLEQELRAMDRLAALGRFSSSVAHEVRNPLAGIAAGAQYLARRMAEGDPAHEHIEFILAEIARLDRIVEGILRATRPPRTNTDLDRTPIPIAPVIERALRVSGTQASERRVQVRWTGDADVCVAMDADSLEQVLVNLLSNAIEASPPGSTVTVEITMSESEGIGAPREPSHTSQDRVVIRVVDNGCGIPSEDVPHVCDPFFTRRTGGTGLGLFVAHGLARQYGGTLSIRSEFGAGTTATLSAPCAAPQNPKRRQPHRVEERSSDTLAA